jgi:hypothetical protein
MRVHHRGASGRGAADLMDYYAVDKKLFVGNHDDGFVASIDAVNNKLLKRIEGLGAGRGAVPDRRTGNPAPDRARRSADVGVHDLRPAGEFRCRGGSSLCRL